MPSSIADLLVHLELGEELPFGPDSRSLSDALDQEPVLALLKFVQGAVALGAGSIDVQLPRGGWHLHFNLPALRSETLLILNAWLNGEPAGWSPKPIEYRALLHFLLGLVYLRSRPPHHTQVKIWCPVAMLLIEVDATGELSTDFQEFESQDSGCTVAAEVHHFQALEFLNRDGAYHKALQESLAARLAVCPVPVTVGDHAQNPVCLEHLPEYPLPRPNRVRGSWQHFSLIERWWLSSDLANDSFLVQSPRLSQPYSIKGLEGSWVRGERPGRAQTAWLEIASGAAFFERHLSDAEGFQLQQMLTVPCLPHEGHSYVYAVIDGVLLNPLPIELGLPGFLAIVADSDLKTEANSLNLVRQPRLESLREGWLAEVETLRTHLRVAAQGDGGSLGFSPEVQEGLARLFPAEDPLQAEHPHYT